MSIDRWIGVGLAGAIGLGSVLAAGIGEASATPVINVSRAAISFGFVPSGVEIPQALFVTNIGDAPLHISGLSLTGTNANDFRLGGTCGAAITLAPGGGRCRVDIASDLDTMGGSVRSATLNIASDSSPGAASVVLSAFYANEIMHGLVTTPAWLDFAGQAVGTAAPSQTVTISSPESIALFYDGAVLVGGDSTDFSLTTNCQAGTRFALNNTTCSFTIGFVPTTTGPRSTQLELDFNGGRPGDRLIYRYSVTGIGGFVQQATPVPAVEFYNASQDHYFMTWVPNEIAILDAGVTIKGWTRTGYSFMTYAVAVAGTSPVCRFYIPPAEGDSHFYGRGTTECTATGAAHPDFVLEDPDFMNMYLPNAGTCPANTTEVFRVFDNRLDANHRYMTDKAVRDQMVAKGWLAEGDGPDLVVMCAPR